MLPILFAACLVQVAASHGEALAADDECQDDGSESCNMNMLQVRSNSLERAWEDESDDLGELLGSELEHDASAQSGTAFKEKFLSCHVEHGQSMFFTANGLSNSHLKKSFAELVRGAFPDKIQKDGGLRVKTLALWDSCFLKEAVWNKDWQCTYKTAVDFENPENYNYSRLSATTDASLFRAVELNGTSFGDLFSTSWKPGSDCEAPGMKLEPYWCEDFGGALQSFKKEHQIDFQVEPISLIDRFASPFLKRAIAELSFRKNISEVPDAKAFLHTLKQEVDALPVGSDAMYEEILADVDIIALDGGNPDLHKFALSKVSPGFAKALKKRILAGKTVFIGRSAGAMIGADDMITYEPNPNLGSYLFGDSETASGMHLIGDCSIRPHWSSKWKPGVVLYTMLTRSKERIIPVRNGEAVSCSRGLCKRLQLSSGASDEIEVGEIGSYVLAAKATCEDESNYGLWDWCSESRHLDLGFIKLPGKCLNLYRSCFRTLATSYCEYLTNHTFANRNKRARTALLEQCLQNGRA